MTRTIEAVIGEKGQVRLLESIRFLVAWRALVTILKEEPAPLVSETALGKFLKADSGNWSVRGIRSG